MVSFRANLISTQYIAQKNSDDTYSSAPVSFVQLNKCSKDEAKVIRKTTDKWAYGDEWGKYIADSLLESAYNGTENSDSFFAITKQEDDLEHLKSEDILALALLSTSSSGEKCIDYAQVEPTYVSKLPEYVHGRKLASYKKIGTALFDGIENLFKSKALSLFTFEKNLAYFINRGYEVVNKGAIYKMVLKR